jgi:hypothetical protein
MNAPAALPVTAPAPKYTTEQIKIAAYISLSNAQAQIGHAMHLLESSGSSTTDLLATMESAARASTNLVSTLLKIRSGE